MDKKTTYSADQKTKDLARVEECAAYCGHVTQMFAFGTTEFGGNGCNRGKCKCTCEMYTESYQCTARIKSRDYNLYTFQVGGNENACLASISFIIERFIYNIQIYLLDVM